VCVCVCYSTMSLKCNIDISQEAELVIIIHDKWFDLWVGNTTSVLHQTLAVR